MPGPLSLSRPKHRGHVAFSACGTRDKLNARPAGATRHFVDYGSLFGTGLIFLDARHSRLIWDGGIPRPPGRRPRPAASLRSLRAALENASRFLSSAPLRVRIPPLAHKKAPWAVMGLGRSVLMAGTEGFEPPTAGTKNRSSTVELRPNVWCCPKATRLVYLICEGIANAVE